MHRNTFARRASIFSRRPASALKLRVESLEERAVPANNLTIEANSGGENESLSLGPYVEIAPELTLIHVGPTRWTIYGELGGGYTYTEIELDGVSQEFDSNSTFIGVEVGTRLRLGMFEAGLGFLSRFQDTDESDPEGGVVVTAFDSTFTGVLVSAALRF